MTSTKAPRKVKAEKLQEWSPIATPETSYASAMRSSVHYSAKTVSSNAFGAGIRLASDDVYDRPYLAVSTIGPQAVPVDYFQNAGNIATLHKNIGSVRDSKQRARFVSVPPEEEAIINAALPLLLGAAELNTHFVDARLRQVLMPTAEGICDENYVALTPLNSAGLNEVINQRIEADIEQHKSRGEKPQYRDRTQLSYGGSKPINASKWAPSMGRAMVFDAPQEQPSTRKAYAIYYKGLQLHEQLKPQLDAYAQWRHKALLINQGQMKGDLDSRTKEAELITTIATRALDLGQAAEAHQLEHWALDPGVELTGPTVGQIEREIVDPRLRDGSFHQRFALWVTSLVKNHRFKPANSLDEISMGMSSDDAARLSSVLKGVAR